MRKLVFTFCLLAIFAFAGCSSRPISKTWHHVKKTYTTTKQVYRTTKAVAGLVNPLEYIYVNQQGEAMTQEGEPFVAQDAVLGPPPQEVD